MDNKLGSFLPQTAVKDEIQSWKLKKRPNEAKRMLLAMQVVFLDIKQEL